MAGYDIPREICPLEKRISDFSVSCGYDPMTVFNDFLTFVIHGFSPGAPPLKNWKYKRRQNIAFMEMTAEWVRLMQDRLKDDESWYDPFGDLYMSPSSVVEPSSIPNAVDDKVIIDQEYATLLITAIMRVLSG